MGAVGFAMFSAAVEMFLRRETREFVVSPFVHSPITSLTPLAVTTDMEISWKGRLLIERHSSPSLYYCRLIIDFYYTVMACQKREYYHDTTK